MRSQRIDGEIGALECWLCVPELRHSQYVLSDARMCPILVLTH